MEEFEENGILYALEDPRGISKYRISEDPAPRPRPATTTGAGAHPRPTARASPNLRPTSCINDSTRDRQHAGSKNESFGANGLKSNPPERKSHAAGIVVGPPKNSTPRLSAQRNSISIDSPSNKANKDEDIADSYEGDALFSGPSTSSSVPRSRGEPELEVEALSKEEILKLKKKYEDSLKIIDKIIHNPAEASIREVNKLLHPPGYSEEVQPRAKSKLSAAEAAELFARRSSSPSLSPSRGRHGARSGPNVLRSQSFDGKRKPSPARTSVTKGGLSLELQADYDRYIQRKKQLIENEKRGEEEKKRYIEEQERRFAKVMF